MSFDSGLAADKLGVSGGEASLVLMRLHRNGFLSRRRLSRICMTKKGVKCRRGRCYSHSFTKKAKDYCRWLTEQKPIQDTYENLVAKDVARSLPKEYKDMFNSSLSLEQSGSQRTPKKKFSEKTSLKLIKALSGELRTVLGEKDILESVYFFVLLRDRALQDRCLQYENKVKDFPEIMKEGVKPLIEMMKLMMNRWHYWHSFWELMLSISSLLKKTLIEVKEKNQAAKPEIDLTLNKVDNALQIVAYHLKAELSVLR